METNTITKRTIKFKTPAVLKLELDAKINAYFTRKGIPKTGDERLYQKTFFFLFAYVFFSTLILATHGPPMLKIFFWSMLGITQACIGFNIMHDACHGSFSSNKWVNSLFSRTLEMMAVSTVLWKQKHNTDHHQAPNSAQDQDIKIPFMRVVEAQPWKPMHRYQHLYFIFLYSSLYFMWVYYSDFYKYFTQKVDGVHQKSLEFSLKEHIIFWTSKVLHILVFIVFPWWKFGFISWFTGYLVFGITCSITISVVFQLAHIVKGIKEVKTTVNGNIPVENVLHQLMTTANFARKSRLAEFLFGGLNFQIEHHLYPHISHVHYFDLSKIVKHFCKKNDLPYLEYSTFRNSLWAHIQRLKELGSAKNLA